MIYSDPPEPGQIVRVRARQYLVEATTAPPHPGEGERRTVKEKTARASARAERAALIYAAEDAA